LIYKSRPLGVGGGLLGEDAIYDTAPLKRLRAVDILQSEVSANDLAGAALINDLIAAREAQLRALQSEGIGGGAQAARILRPLDVQISRYRLAPIRIIEPEEEVAETLEFNPAKIRAAIDAGRRAVDREWDALEPLLS
jgi:NTE family protein